MPVLTPHQISALDYKTHVSLTANAGSGKTFVLSKRYLEIALSERISLRNIAAITFTDKAASELYNKIAKQIEERINQSSNKSEIKKLENIRRQLVSANISTIHSFCIDILREYPVEAGLDANFTPIDERLSGELIEISVEELIKLSLENPEEAEDLKYLIRIFASKNLFARELSSLIRNRKNVIALAETLYQKSEEEIADYFSQKFESLLKILLQNKENLLENIYKINQSVLSARSNNEKALIAKQLIEVAKTERDYKKVFSLINRIKSLICTTKSKILKQGYLGKEREAVEEACSYVEDYFDDFPVIDFENSQQIELELAEFGKRTVKFFNKALELYSEKKRENGYLDYEDILLFTQKILTDDEVRLALSGKYKYIMIDEYQDTNELQYQIFLPILDYLTTGNLFVVGDEKQSIYMFRDAELEIFNRTKTDIKNKSGEDRLLDLPDSFRMAPGLCLFTNYLFRNLFNNPELLFNEVEHSDLICARADDEKGEIEILISDKEAGDTEAEMVAGRILKLKNEKSLTWNDIAVLCRRRKSFIELEKMFSEYNIPFSILGGKGFYQTQIIYDVYNYFSFLLDSQNDTALAGVLRSPFFSLSDAEIFEISLEHEKGLWKKLISIEKKKDKYSTVVKYLSENLSLANTLDTAALLRKILNESAFLAVLASKQNGVQELANIDKLIKLTIDFNSQGFNTLYDYLDFLKESINYTEDEPQAGVADDSDSVKIMTLHQAKGLEFAAVFLYNCLENTRSTQTKSKTIVVNKHLGLLTKVPVNQNYFGEYKTAPIAEINNFISNKKNSAEVKRLFYVGVTRAKDYLFLSAEKKESYPADSFIGLLQQALKATIDKNEIQINSDLKFLRSNDGGYFNETKNISVIIPILRNISEPVFPRVPELEDYNPKSLLISSIEDRPEGEIISATKVAVYKQCPLKYKLTYELGFLPLYTGYKNRIKGDAFNYEFNAKENNILNDDDSDNIKNPQNNSDIKGRIIHKILQEQVPADQLSGFISNAVKNEMDVFNYSEITANELLKDIVNDITNFYRSDIYSEINKYEHYKNEFEIYIKENNYFLYGIIDRLVITGNKAIIIDYKTDNIQEKEINERAGSYLSQLRFYSYIVDRFFRNITQFELNLIFIKHPEKPVELIVKKEDLPAIGREIFDMVCDIRNSVFSKNINHCNKCSYSIGFNRCVVEDNISS
ncbi:MAG: UvrD-helicase domain-containing protein [Ignavibacteriaceae bacterium]